MSKFFINNPIMSMVISIVMVIVGGLAMLTLPTALFPELADPQIQVTAMYPGADALTLDQSVATPIEQMMSGVDNMELHVFDEPEQRSDALDRGLRYQDRCQHRFDSHSDAPVPGCFAATV